VSGVGGRDGCAAKKQNNRLGFSVVWSVPPSITAALVGLDQSLNVADP
jgi:hypothetical protein